MKKKRLRFGKGFRVAVGNRNAQAAEMVIPSGASEGGPRNRHRGSDQWLYVVGGSGSATINGKRHVLHPGTVILIERGDVHEIRNTGRTLLQTLNVYVPPAYNASGDPLPRGRK